jgi:hypothetical protein
MTPFTPILRRLTFANVTSALALFVAVGGTSYAAATLPANSVGTKQIRDRSISVPKLDNAARAALLRAGAPGPQGVAGVQGAQGPQGQQGDAGPTGTAVLGDGSITAAKLADSSVTEEKLGLTTVMASTGVQSTGSWVAAAHCPPGKSIISGAVEVVDQNDHPLNGVAAISYSGPITWSGSYWEGAAYRTSGTTPWGLDVIAFCMPS